MPRILKSGIPVWIVNVIVNWYSELYVAVRWNSTISHFFNVKAGVLQGVILSPALFILFINIFIVQLKESRYGCFININFMGCILYADDIILLSAPIDGLQKMLNVCSTVATEIHLTFNCNKSACLAFGPNWRNPVMCLSGSSVGLTSCYKYLGVTLL